LQVATITSFLGHSNCQVSFRRSRQLLKASIIFKVLNSRFSGKKQIANLATFILNYLQKN